MGCVVKMCGCQLDLTLNALYMSSTTGSLPSHPTGTNRGHCNIMAQYQINNLTLIYYKALLSDARCVEQCT